MKYSILVNVPLRLNVQNKTIKNAEQIIPASCRIARSNDCLLFGRSIMNMIESITHGVWLVSQGLFI